MRHIGVVVLLLAAILSACSSSASAPQAPTIQPAAGASSPAAGSAQAQQPAGSAAPGAAGSEGIVIGFGAQEYERQVYQPLIDAFNRENPGLRVQFVSLDEIFNSGGQSQVYDPNAMMRRVVSAADTAVNWSVTPDMVKNGLVRDLKPLIDADASFDSADYWAGALGSGEIEGGTYMLPRNMRIRLLNYNKDMFAARGIAEPQPDWSWDELLDAAEQAAQKNGDTVDVYGFLDWSPEFTVLLGELALRNVDLWNTSANQIDLDTPAMAEAIERTKALVDSGAIYFKARNPTDSISSDQFTPLINEQKAAIWPLELQNMGPQGTTLPFATGTVLFPELPMPYWNGGAEGYLMSSGTRYPNEAWRWLSWLSRQEIKQPFAGPDAQAIVPARKSIADAGGYWSKLDAGLGEAIKASLERPQARPPSGANDGRFYEPLSKAMQAVLSDKQDSRQALQEAQQSLEQLLAQASPSPSAAAADSGPVVVATPVSDQAPPGVTTISFAAFGGDPSVARRIAREFNDSNTGVWVEVKDIQPGPGPMKLADMASQVDCFNWWGTLATEEVTATLDLKPLVDADAAFPLDEYPPALLAPYTRGDALHGLPQFVNFRALMYNPQAFEQAGLEAPAIDWTIDDFTNAAEQLTTGQGETKQFGYVSFGGTGDLVFWIQQAGGSPITGSGDTAQPNFVDPKVSGAIRNYLDLLKNASPHEKLSGYGRNSMGDDTYNLISQGRAGMWFDYGWSVGMGGPDQSFKPAMAPLPLGGRSLTRDDMTVRGLHISAGTEQPQACWSWLKHLSGQTGTFDGSFPARSSLADDESFVAQLPDGAVDVYRAYRDLLRQAPAGEQAEPYYQSRIDLFWFFRAVDRALQGEDLERELQDAQALTEQFAACVAGDTKASECAKQVDPDYDGWQSAPETTP